MAKIKPYCIGSDEWNGLSKLIEEMSELGEVCGKIIGSEGDANHWTGNLRVKFIEEISDVKAAVEFFRVNNFNSEENQLIEERADMKLRIFQKWNLKKGNADDADQD